MHHKRAQALPISKGFFRTATSSEDVSPLLSPDPGAMCFSLSGDMEKEKVKWWTMVVFR